MAQRLQVPAAQDRPGNPASGLVIRVSSVLHESDDGRSWCSDTIAAPFGRPAFRRGMYGAISSASFKTIHIPGDAMKNSLHLFTLLTVVAGGAAAQTAVSVYGLMDLGVVAESGGPGGSLLKLTSGISAGSRIGFRGTEDLGDGLKAKFVIESGIAADTGGVTQGGLVYGRQAFVGLDGHFGSLTAGRQYAPHFLAIDDIDPFGTGL
ncbi:MAG TPA: porin, partial [Noviherbaspirillum sp.]